MKNFVVIYNAPMGVVQQAAIATPEVIAEGMDNWMRWAEKCGDMMVDMGAPLSNCVQVCAPGTDCGVNTICGYSVMRGNNVTEIENMMVAHPHMAMGPGCWITVCEAMPVMVPVM